MFTEFFVTVFTNVAPCFFSTLGAGKAVPLGEIYKFLKYSFSYDGIINKDSLKKQLNTLLNSPKITKAQKEVVKKLIGILQ
ncbi:hypothetical protein [Thermoanaerobacter mathranii]|uniref:hypothetical protein n=1 Tax=Thermoanaerobacter mathranii TaxID=583357 RepID=UPI003D6AB008